MARYASLMHPYASQVGCVRRVFLRRNAPYRLNGALRFANAPYALSAEVRSASFAVNDALLKKTLSSSYTGLTEASKRFSRTAHINGKELGRLEPTPSLKYRTEACMA